MTSIFCTNIKFILNPMYYACALSCYDDILKLSLVKNNLVTQKIVSFVLRDYKNVSSYGNVPLDWNTCHETDTCVI